MRGPVSLICYLKSGSLFQIRIAYDLLAAGDEIAQSLALEKTIGKKIMPEDFKTVRTVQDVVEVVYKLVNSK